MSATTNQTSLEQMLGVYKWVVDDVVKNVRDEFLNEGFETQVLEDLKTLWESKLVQSGALSRPTKTSSEAQSNASTSHDSAEQTRAPTGKQIGTSVIHQGPQHSVTNASTITTSLSNTIGSQSPTTSAAVSLDESANLLAQQAALYSAVAAGAANLPSLMLSNQGGLSILQQGGMPYAAVQTPNGITYLPIAVNLPQSLSQQQGSTREKDETHEKHIPQSDGPLPISARTKDNAHQLIQLDGPADGSSSEDSDELSSESDADDNDGLEEDPLCSDDDANSDDEENVWDTDNTIVCQFEKVYRVRTKWKFALKEGIMNLCGHDYIFIKINGEADCLPKLDPSMFQHQYGVITNFIKAVSRKEVYELPSGKSNNYDTTIVIP